jgi:hypothetical protein
MSDPTDPRRDPRRDDVGAASTPLILTAAVALALIAGFFVFYSYRGSERIDDTAAIERSSTAPTANPNAGRRPETSGANVPPAAAPSPNR